MSRPSCPASPSRHRCAKRNNAICLEMFCTLFVLEDCFRCFLRFQRLVESISCEASKSCQVRGSNPCRDQTGTACVSTRSSKKRGMHSVPEFVGLYRRRPPRPPTPPTQLPTQNSYPWYSVPPILFGLWSGRQDLNLRVPSPEACGLRYLLEIKRICSQKTSF
jgi:hypothetical protein